MPLFYPQVTHQIGGNTAGATADISSGTYILAGGNNVTLSQSVNSVTISAGGGGAGLSAGISTLGNTSGDTGLVTGRLVLAGTNLTLSGSTNAGSMTITISGGAAGAGDGFNILAAGTQTALTNTTVLFVDSNGISFGMSSSSRITASYTVPSVPPETPFAISAGTQSVSTGTVVFSNSNGISFGMSGSSRITASYTVPTQTVESQSIGMHTSTAGGGTGGTSGSATGGAIQYNFFAGSNITLSQSVNAASGSLTIYGTSGGGGPGGAINRSFIEIMEGDILTHACSITGASYSKRPIFVPFWLDGENLSVKTIDFWASRPAGTSLNMTYGIGFYSMANSTQISLLSSTTNAISVTTSAQFSGVRRYQITGLSNLTLSEGRWIAGLYFSGSNNSTAVANLVLYGGQTLFGVNGYVYPGTNSTGATSGSEHVFPFWGVYSATTGGLPGSVARSEISGHGATGTAAVNADVYMVIREI